MDEFESMVGGGTDQPDDNIVTNTIKESENVHKSLDVLNQVINSPLIASANDEIIYIFEDATILLNMICSRDKLKELVNKLKDQLSY